jgi:glycosyltransferase involved in cell wall biosynthesis
MNVESNTAKSPHFSGGFTVLMAVYKKDDLGLFERAVHSVYANTLPPDAFILVVDGPVPTDLNAAIIVLRDKYGIKVLQLPANVGVARALNIGLEHVRTTWVLRADADDYNLPSRFSLQAAAIADSNGTLDLIGGAIEEVTPSGVKIGVRRTVEQHSEIIRYAAYRNPFNHMTVAYKTELALRCTGYPEIHLKEDYALWAKMIAAGAFTLNLPNTLVLATTGKDMYRRRGGLRYALAEISLQRHLVRTGIKSTYGALSHGAGRAFVFLLPSTVRGWIYENILRASS